MIKCGMKNKIFFTILGFGLRLCLSSKLKKICPGIYIAPYTRPSVYINHSCKKEVWNVHYNRAHCYLNNIEILLLREKRRSQVGKNSLLVFKNAFVLWVNKIFIKVTPPLQLPQLATFIFFSFFSLTQGVRIFFFSLIFKEWKEGERGSNKEKHQCARYPD